MQTIEGEIESCPLELLGVSNIAITDALAEQHVAIN
jgi:hypothetical protein